MRSLLLTTLCTALGVAQTPAELMNEPSVKAALEAVKRNEPRLIDEQARFCEIPAPPFKEQVRAAEFKRLFEKLGLQNVFIDKAGNVLGTRPGAALHPNLVFSAHLDTVFPEGTDVKVKREGNVMRAPGIGDDCRGLAVMLGVIQALNEGNVRTAGTITFVADVGEEGLGDLRGMKELFYVTLKDKIDRFISVDGIGLGIAHIGVGSMRYRVSFKGPGGHSYGSFGNANPMHALGRAIARISDFEVPTTPKTTFNVGRIGGGTSVNSIPFEAWMEVDMRSPDKDSLKALNTRFLEAVKTAVDEENRRWKDNGKISGAAELVGLRPAGQTPVDSPIVQTALSVSRALGIKEILRDGSTDSNVPMNLGIPAITISGGGTGSGAHSLNEMFDSTDSWIGTQRALLLAISLAR